MNLDDLRTKAALKACEGVPTEVLQSGISFGEILHASKLLAKLRSDTVKYGRQAAPGAWHKAWQTLEEVLTKESSIA